MWCSQSGDHPENNLAKFGYILDMKGGKQTESFNILGYLSELIKRMWWFDFKQFTFSKLFEFETSFPRKFLRIGWNHIFQVKIRKSCRFCDVVKVAIDPQEDLAEFDCKLNMLILWHSESGDDP